MKYLILFLSISLILGCGVAGFQPPRQHFSWYLHDANRLFPRSDPDSLIKYVDRKEKDMRSCGIDPVIGESDSAKAGLCMESKGWYLKTGPLCDDPMMYNDPLCVKWRATHKR